jgi:hypothetical protein
MTWSFAAVRNGVHLVIMKLAPVTVCVAGCNLVKKPYYLPRESIYYFQVILRINNDNFPAVHRS